MYSLGLTAVLVKSSQKFSVCVKSSKILNEYFMEPAANYQSDVLVIGSGAAGLTTALQLTDHHSVIIVSKGPLTEGSTY